MGEEEEDAVDVARRITCGVCAGLAKGTYIDEDGYKGIHVKLRGSRYMLFFYSLCTGYPPPYPM